MGDRIPGEVNDLQRRTRCCGWKEPLHCLANRRIRWLADVRWCACPVTKYIGERRTGGHLTVSRLLDVCCELRKQRNCNNDGSRPSDQGF